MAQNDASPRFTRPECVEAIRPKGQGEREQDIAYAKLAALAEGAARIR